MMAKRKLDDTKVRELLIDRGVVNLREFGYPDCTAENIMQDMVYKAFFKSMLEDNKGHGYDKQINALLAEIK